MRKENLVKEVISEEEAQVILSIPLPQYHMDDNGICGIRIGVSAKKKQNAGKEGCGGV